MGIYRDVYIYVSRLIHIYIYEYMSKVLYIWAYRDG